MRVLIFCVSLKIVSWIALLSLWNCSLVLEEDMTGVKVLCEWQQFCSFSHDHVFGKNVLVKRKAVVDQEKLQAFVCELILEGVFGLFDRTAFSLYC